VVAALTEVEREHPTSVLRLGLRHGNGELDLRVHDVRLEDADGVVVLVDDGRAAEVLGSLVDAPGR
jgi:hypothetical protein